MKTHRNILLISLCISIMSFIFVMVLPQSSKFFQIALGFMGSAFISFMVELPNYQSLKKQNLINLYYSLFNLKSRISFLKENISYSLSNFDIITDKFYEQNLQSIDLFLNNLKAFDPDFNFSKKKNGINSEIINSLTNSYNNLSQAALKYTSEYYTKRIEINEVEGRDRNVNPKEVSHGLDLIYDMCTSFSNIIDEHSLIILPKKLHNKWRIDNSIIVNANDNSRISQ